MTQKHSDDYLSGTSHESKVVLTFKACVDEPFFPPSLPHLYDELSVIKEGDTFFLYGDGHKFQIEQLLGNEKLCVTCDLERKRCSGGVAPFTSTLTFQWDSAEAPAFSANLRGVLHIGKDLFFTNHYYKSELVESLPSDS